MRHRDDRSSLRISSGFCDCFTYTRTLFSLLLSPLFLSHIHIHTHTHGEKKRRTIRRGLTSVKNAVHSVRTNFAARRTLFRSSLAFSPVSSQQIFLILVTTVADPPAKIYERDATHGQFGRRDAPPPT